MPRNSVQGARGDAAATRNALQVCTAQQLATEYVTKNDCLSEGVR